MINRIKQWFYNRKILTIQEFAHHHKSFLVMVCDPRDDTMFISYRDKIVSGKVKSADGKDYKVVRNVLKHSTFEREIDRFLGGIIDILRTPLKEGNMFYQFIDAALFRITKSLKFKKQ